MDCDYDPNVASTSNEKNKKKRNRYDKKGNKIEKSDFDENDKRFEKYTDELYKLDYEDMIGDIPCRFKYREVMPNDFGLSVEEILIAKDRELNRWCSLKKATQHRPEHVERYEVMAYRKKSENESLKKKILASLYEELEEPTEDEYIKINKERIQMEQGTEKGDSSDENEVQIAKKNKNKRRSNTESIEENFNIEGAHLSNEIVSTNVTINETSNILIKENKPEIQNTFEDNTKSEDTITLVKPSPNSKKSKKKRRRTSETNNEQNIEKSSPEKEIKQDNKTTVSQEDTGQNNGKLSRRQRRNMKKLQQKETIKKETVEITTTEKKQNDGKKKKRKNKKKPQQTVTSSDSTEITENTLVGKKQPQNRKRKQSEQGNEQSPTKKFKPNKNKKLKVKKEDIDISNSRLQAYGFNPKKFKNKLKYKKNIVTPNIKQEKDV